MSEKDILRENAEIVHGIENVPPTGDIPLPERQLFALERTRREALAAVTKRPAGHVEKIVRPVFFRRILQVAAALLVLCTLAWQFLPRQPEPVQVARVVITSPGDTVGSTRPTIAWTSKDAPGQRYDVWILPVGEDHLTAKTLFKKENVVSPVEFSELAPGKGLTASALAPGTDYQVLVCLAGGGRMAGVPVPFKTSPTAK